MSRNTQPDLGSVALQWWRTLTPDEDGGMRGDPGALARLRRARTPLEAMTEPAAVALYHDLQAHGMPLGSRDFPRVALLAMVLAHIREHQPAQPSNRANSGHPMHRLGPAKPKEVDAAKLKPLRLKRLLSTRPGETEDLLRQFRRLIHLADRTACVATVARALWRWEDERPRAEWGFAYYNATPPAEADA